ncbi:hypothetical protein V6N13_051169 [Hibiscus sabdariffa]
MLVDNSRHRQHSRNRNVSALEAVKGVQGLSRFAVLEDMNVEDSLDGGVDARTILERPRPTLQEMERKKGASVESHVVAPKEFTSSATYLASYLGKKKKSVVPREAVEVDAIPSMEDQNPKLVVRLLNHAKGDHTVVAIMESPLHGKGSTGIRIDKPHGVVNMSSKENFKMCDDLDSATNGFSGGI